MKHENDSLNDFKDLQIYFRENLNDNISHIQNLWLTVNKDKTNIDGLKKLRHALLRLANKAGTFGAGDMSYYSRKLELLFNQYIVTETESCDCNMDSNKINELFKRLNCAKEEWITSELAENKLEKHSYKVKQFNNIIDLENEYNKENAGIVIVDDKCIDNKISGLPIVTCLKEIAEFKSSISGN
ncbi:MAG: hypothetical protein QM484_05205 [Woeseiaceae bacterium]